MNITRLLDEIYKLCILLLLFIWGIIAIGALSGGESKLKKENPAEVFSDEFCEIFKNTYFAEHLQMVSSGDGCTIKSISNY